MSAIAYCAVQHEGRVYSMPRPCRHHHIIHANSLPPSAIQGFVSVEGEFLTRAEAFHVAKAAGQLKARGPGEYSGALLFSEDVW